MPQENSQNLCFNCTKCLKKSFSLRTRDAPWSCWLSALARGRGHLGGCGQGRVCGSWLPRRMRTWAWLGLSLITGGAGWGCSHLVFRSRNCHDPGDLSIWIRGLHTTCLGQGRDVRPSSLQGKVYQHAGKVQISARPAEKQNHLDSVF